MFFSQTPRLHTPSGLNFTLDTIRNSGANDRDFHNAVLANTRDFIKKLDNWQNMINDRSIDQIEGDDVVQKKDRVKLWIVLWTIFAIGSAYAFTTWPADDHFIPDQGLGQQIAAKGLPIAQMTNFNILDGATVTIFSNQADFVRNLKGEMVLYSISATTVLATSQITVTYYQVQANGFVEFVQSEQYETRNYVYLVERASLQEVKYGKNVIAGAFQVGFFTIIFAIVEGVCLLFGEWLWDATDGMRARLRLKKK